MTEKHRSLLQTEILLHLNEKPIRTLVDLAQGINSTRSVVSRSISLLRKQGLVYRDGQGWHLSNTGKIEADEDQADLAEAIKIMKQATARSSETLQQLYQAVGSTIKDFYPPESSLKNYYSPELFKIPVTYSASMKTALDLANSPVFKIAQSVGNQYFEALNKSGGLKNLFLSNEAYQNYLKPIIEMQERTSRLIEESISSLAVKMSVAAEAALNQNNLALSTTIADLIVIGNSAFTQDVQTKFSWLATDLSKVTQAFSQVYSIKLVEFEAARFSVADTHLTDRWVIPSRTCANYTNSVRDYIAADQDPELPTLEECGFEELGDQSLDALLSEINLEYVEMRQGAWSAISHPGPDRLRHAAVSQRELIRMLLQQLVPDSQLPEENRQGTQLKARIRTALGASESEAQFVAVLANAVEHLYGQLNKYTHHNEKHEESLRALLHTGEGLMRYLLALLNQHS